MKIFTTNECSSFEQAVDEACVMMEAFDAADHGLRNVYLTDNRWAQWFESVPIVGDVVGLRGALADPDVGVRSMIGRSRTWLTSLDGETFGALSIRARISGGPSRDHVAPRNTVVVSKKVDVLSPVVCRDTGHYVLRGGRFVNVSRDARNRRGSRAADSSSINDAVVACLGIEMFLRYEWQVSIGGFSFAVNRASCAGLFATRDALPGRSRRSALRHFVEKYTRRRPADADGPSDVDVRRYLRGQMRFSWNGLDCEIIPPAFEVEAIEASKR